VPPRRPERELARSELANEKRTLEAGACGRLPGRERGRPARSLRSRGSSDEASYAINTGGAGRGPPKWGRPKGAATRRGTERRSTDPRVTVPVVTTPSEWRRIVCGLPFSTACRWQRRLKGAVRAVSERSNLVVSWRGLSFVSHYPSQSPFYACNRHLPLTFLNLPCKVCADYVCTL